MMYRNRDHEAFIQNGIGGDYDTLDAVEADVAEFVNKANCSTSHIIGCNYTC